MIRMTNLLMLMKLTLVPEKKLKKQCRRSALHCDRHKKHTSCCKAQKVPPNENQYSKYIDKNLLASNDVISGQKNRHDPNALPVRLTIPYIVLQKNGQHCMR
uniref:Uncharacterized protein n=1 Tax=Romanomermis culicivorax TaxID=13658 RepID=A0A915JLL5_ROMCU